MKTTQYLKSSITNGSTENRLFVAMEITQHMDEYLPWLQGRELAGLSIKSKTDEWMATLKAWSGGKPQVAFFVAESLEELYYAVAWALLWDLVKWKPDKWGTIRSDET